MKNEAHVIGDRVPNERDLILELKLAPQSAVNTQPVKRAKSRSAARFPLARRFAGFVIRKLRERGNRLALLELNDDQLKDIGLSRCQAYGGYSRYRRSTTLTPDENGDAEPH
ncbi:hypothetical protein ADU59_12595 [Pararhizobium polonicum]|uniref:YjiS-like domain-containing protein n=1 Tax=Pararhizobium polonicum TaxID=1612624 RepID=A0A1C7P295_9HYPH|nr:DUF1127 domain-containing protein [Pararhizobium polonicum]OBZ95403.1 hypothetical protein ADU59_12595 [Pararhizobium polonicum]